MLLHDPVAWLSNNVIAYLLIKDHGSIPGSAVQFFSCLELSHGMYDIGDPVFHCPLSIFCPMLSLEEIPALCWPQVKGSPHLFPLTPRLVLLKVKFRKKKKNIIFYFIIRIYIDMNHPSTPKRQRCLYSAISSSRFLLLIKFVT